MSEQKEKTVRRGIANAFSLQMITSPATVRVEEVPREEALQKEVKSFIGHQDTANVLGVPFNRTNITLKKGDVLYVAQLQGGRLPEGATTLPEGFSFKFLRVEVV